MHKLGTVVLCLAVAGMSSSAAIVIKGKAVMGDEAKPVPGLIVRVEHHENRHSRTPDDFFREVRTDEEGGFVVELPSFGEEYMLYLADDAGHVFMGYTHLSGQEDADLGTLSLGRGCELAGLVKNDGGDPVPGATVTATLRLLKRSCRHYLDAASTGTGADGTFVFEDLSPGEYELRTVAEPFAPATARLTVGDDVNYVEQELQAGCTIEGRVADAEGNPLAGVEVSAGRDRRTTTAEDGRYVLNNVAPGRQSVSARLADYAMKSGDAVVVTCKAGTPAKKDLMLVRTGRIEIRLQPVAGDAALPASVRVTLQTRNGRSRHSTIRSYKVTAGTVSLDQVVLGSHDVRVAGDGVQGYVKDVQVAAGETTAIDIALQPTFKVAGRVMGEGVPIEGVQVHVSRDGEDDVFNDTLYERTGKDGAFSVELPLPGTYETKIRHEEWMPLTTNLLVGSNGVPDLEIVLQPGLKIAGTIAEADGSAPDNLRVNVMGPAGASGRDRIWKDAEVDAEGAFELSGLAEGKYDLYVRNRDSQEEEVRLAGVEAGSDDVFVSLAQKHTVSLLVTGPDGQPVAGVAVAARKKREDGGVSFRSSRDDAPVTDAGGRIALTLRVGPAYTVTAERRPYLPARVTVDLSDGKAPPADVVVLALQRGCTIRGVVVEVDSGQPMPGLRVSAAAGDDLLGFSRSMGLGEDDEGVATTDEQGRFTLEGVPPGIVKVHVFSAGESSALLGGQNVQAQTNMVSETRIEIRQPGSVEGRVVDVDGNGVGSCQVMLQSKDASRIQPIMARTEDDGSFSLSGVAPGAYRVMWYVMSEGESVRPSMATVTVASGQTARLELGGKAVDAGGQDIKGTVTKSGEPFGPGTLAMLPKTDGDESPSAMLLGYQGARQGEIADDGTFTVENVTPGAYIYTVVSEEGGTDGTPRMFSGQIEMAKGQSTVDIRIEGCTLKGRVTGADGAPLAEAYVMAMPDGQRGMAQFQRMRYAQTGADGVFELECIPAGVYNLQVRHDTGSAVRKGVAVSNAVLTVDIALAAGFAVTGTVTCEAGGTARGAMVLATSDGDGSTAGFAMAGEDGGYELDPVVPAGNYHMYLFKDGYAAEVRAVDVAADTVVDAELVPGGSIRVVVEGADTKGRAVRVKTAEGVPVLRCAGEEWFVAVGPWAALAAPTLDDGGTARMAALRPGDYVVSVEGSAQSATATVKALAETTVKLSL